MTAGPTWLVIFCYKKESWEQLSLLCSIHKIKTFFWLLVTTRSPKLHLSTLWLLLSCLVWLVLLFSLLCPIFQSSSLLFAASFFSHLPLFVCCPSLSFQPCPSCCCPIVLCCSPSSLRSSPFHPLLLSLVR